MLKDRPGNTCEQQQKQFSSDDDGVAGCVGRESSLAIEGVALPDGPASSTALALTGAARAAESGSPPNSSQHRRGEEISTRVNKRKKSAIQLYSLHWKINLVCVPNCIISPNRSDSIAAPRLQSQLLLISHGGWCG